jgi:hypothetical protein
VLTAFVRAHDACPASGIAQAPAVLPALAKHLGGPIRYVDLFDLERAQLPGYDPYLRQQPGVEAHQRALLAGLAVAANGVMAR